MDNDLIEVIPLAFMRGRTFNDAFIILDEAQNTSVRQMLMVLTRMGMRSKMVVTGDTTQIDLPEDTPSGLLDAWDRLKGVKGIGFSRLTPADIVRHSLVQTIVNLYERRPPAAAPPAAAQEGG
jgi:phosphate starvation-inducible PhoH-like protein